MSFFIPTADEGSYSYVFIIIRQRLIGQTHGAGAMTTGPFTPRSTHTGTSGDSQRSATTEK